MLSAQKFTGLALNIASDLAVSLKKDLAAAAAEGGGTRAAPQVAPCPPN